MWYNAHLFMEFLCLVLECSSVAPLSMDLVKFLHIFFGFVAAFFPCRMFFKDSPPFLCFYFDFVLLDVLLPIPSPATLILLDAAMPPLSLRLRVMEDVDRM